MEHVLHVKLIDISDERLLLILNKLTNIEVLYSLIGVNIRLDKIENDPRVEFFFSIFLCLEDIHLDRIFINHIATLTITIVENKMIPSTSDTMNIVCTHVSTMFSNLICLKFHPYSDFYIDSI